MDNIIKFTQEELDEIKALGNKYQNNVFKFGELYVEKLNIDTAYRKLSEKEKHLQSEYSDIEKLEQSILDKLVNKYGDGTVNIKDGTFTPSPKT